MEKRFEIYAQLAAVIILVAGCFLVLRPFMTAMLLAAVVCVSTWPMYLWLLHKLKNRQNLAALTMTLSLTLLVILPLALVAYNLADNVTAFYNAVRQSMEAGPPEPPAWLTGLPLLGGPIEEYWRNIASSQEEMLALAKRLLEPARNFLLASGILLGQGVMEMSLAAFISFFFYRDGEALIRSIGVGMERLAGIHAANMLVIINSTVRGVMYGLLGTALAQGFVATIGFAIAGVPAVMLLGVATFLLSLIPIGPPLIWGGAAIWLFQQGETGWGIFMLLWGFFLISSVDNIIKPLLISRGSSLPFLLVILGVMGGVLAFGFVGIFIGPTLLAVGFSVVQKWTSADSTTTS
ncbi:MAG: AI-2E family transporter [Sulfuricella sp.]|nr:AI-2E family transporter [Sulfuricella sp.]